HLRPSFTLNPARRVHSSDHLKPAQLDPLKEKCSFRAQEYDLV
ncbi:3019_t:CDS:1, partial [Acaulospora colombiana]